MASAFFFFFLLPVAFLSALLHHPTPTSACPNIPSMTIESACEKSTGTQLMYELCKDTLHDVPSPSLSNGVDLYALVAAKRAVASYNGTAIAAGDQRGNASLPGDERDAYAICVDAYGAAKDTMDAVVDALVGCRFREGDLGQVYRDGVQQVEECRDLVMKMTASPIYARCLVDRNLPVLAYFLGKLLGVQDARLLV